MLMILLIYSNITIRRNFSAKKQSRDLQQPYWKSRLENFSLSMETDYPC